MAGWEEEWLNGATGRERGEGQEERRERRGDREEEKRGTGRRKRMQVSLYHHHAHHGSMCTDGRTRVGGEEATARRSRKKGHTGTTDGG